MTATPIARWTRVAAVLVLGAALEAAPAPQNMASLAGRWDATVVVNGVEIPCQFEIDGSGAAMKAAFFNSSLRIVSTATTIDNDTITFNYDQYGTRLQVKAQGGQLVGNYLRARGGYPFTAVRAAAESAPTGNVPSIDGTWIVKARGSKGEAAWRFIANQKGAHVEATILRVDGDTGALDGSYKDGKFVLSHFDGSRPMLMEVTVNPDGTLKLVENGKTESIAARADTEAAKEIGAPEDPTYHTSVKNASEPFKFDFPDLSGKMVSNTDFLGKVVLVSISGSWCPNCHDEAPFLVSLYNKYKSQGFEVVSLSFERGAQLKDPEQLRAFIKTYGIDYPVLLPGEPDQASDLLPQTVNLDCFPTSFILDKTGRVRMVHAGFPSPGSGEYYTEAVNEVTQTVEHLLAEKPSPQ